MGVQTTSGPATMVVHLRLSLSSAEKRGSMSDPGSSLYIKLLTIVSVLNKQVAPDNKRSPSSIVVTMDLLDKFRVDEKENESVPKIKPQL